MLQVSFGQTDIAARADIMAADSLRNGSFDAGSLLVLVLKGLSALPLAGGFQGLELYLGPKGEPGGAVVTFDSGRAGRGLTGAWLNLSRNHRPERQ